MDEDIEFMDEGNQVENINDPTIPRSLVETFERLIDELDNSVENSVSQPTLNEIDNEIAEIATDTLDEEPQVSEEQISGEPEQNDSSYIPINPGDLQIEETTSRFSSAVWFDRIQTTNITLAGLGGIGSYVGFLLSRMKPNSINLYDPDLVELGNLSGQLYRMQDEGIHKAMALYNQMKAYSNYYRSTALCREYLTIDTPDKIMICGFDNMAARKAAFRSWKRSVITCPCDSKDGWLFIDGRLAAEEFQVFAIEGDNQVAMETYESKWLFSDEEAEETLCSYKQTSFMANMIGSVIVNIFVNFIANQCDPIFPRDVPFLTQYDASRMWFKVEM